jgi:hypothetical protein
MNYLVPAQAGAQLLSLFIFATMARWYVAPRLAKLGRADALVLLLWMHAFRYIALQAFSAQRDGFPISDSALMEIVLGDLGGAVIALAAIFALRHRMRIGNCTFLGARGRDPLRYRQQHPRRNAGTSLRSGRRGDLADLGLL